jgi:hypothetical protein
MHTGPIGFSYKSVKQSAKPSLQIAFTMHLNELLLVSNIHPLTLPSLKESDVSFESSFDKYELL